MREMKDSGVEWIGEIPIDWGIAKFKHFFSIIGGCGFKEEYQGESQGDYPFLKASDINGYERTVSSAKNYVNQNLVQQEKYNVVPSYSIIIAKIGEALKKNHRKINTCDCIIDNNCEAFSLIPDADSDISYLYYVLSHIDMVWFDNGGTVPSVNNEKLRDFFLPNPSNVTQHRIAGYLDAKCAKIDRAIARQQEAIEKLKEYKLSVITEKVTMGLNPDAPMKDSGIEWIGEIPEQWETVAFGRVAQVKSNLVDPSLYPDLPQISPESIEKDSGRLLSYSSVDESGVFSYNHYFYTGQILYSKIRPKLNKACIAPFEGLCSADMYPIETNADTRFILYCIISYSFLSQVIMVTESRVKMPKINQSELARIMIALPPEKQAQELIAEYLDRFCEKLDLVLGRKKVLIDKLTEYKKAFIYEAVTGKREV